MIRTDFGVLDNPAWAALAGPQAHLAEHFCRAARYPVDVAPFVALADTADERAWADLAVLAGPGGRVLLAGVDESPVDWPVVARIDGVQLVGSAVVGRPDPEVRRLGPADVPEMLDLVARTEPGPFRPRTIELGTYLGIRRGGDLVAMAGERLHPPGWTEISAVCTDQAYRGLGLASRLVGALTAGIRDRGEKPFLHAAANNTTAISLYETLGFTLRRQTTFLALRAPDPALAPA